MSQIHLGLPIFCISDGDIGTPLVIDRVNTSSKGGDQKSPKCIIDKGRIIHNHGKIMEGL